MRLPTETAYLVTLGGEDLVDPAKVIARREYAHPLYTPASVAAQARLPECASDRVAFAGAYHGWGFHEDGARSGLKAAERLGFRWLRKALSRVSTPRLAGVSPGLDLQRRGARGLPDHHHAHPAQAVQAHLHPSLVLVAGRPRRPAGPRGAGAVRGARPPGPAARDAARERHGVPRPARHRPDHVLRARSDPDGRASARVRAVLQPDQRLLVLRRRRATGRDDRRGAQHLRRPARLPRAAGRTGPGEHRQADVRLALPRRRRPLRAGRAGARRAASTSPSPCTPTAARRSAPRWPASGCPDPAAVWRCARRPQASGPHS